MVRRAHRRRGLEQRRAAVPQDPATIQRQIEQTRAELAEAIDAIADIVSPKRLAERAKVQVGAKVSELRQKMLPTVQPTPELEPGADEAEASDYPPALVEGEVVVRRTVRWDRVVLASGALVLVVVVGGRRRRRRRSRGA
jgi:hypothetical protein